MKYLIFNIAVFLALGYLITDGNLPAFQAQPVDQSIAVQAQSGPKAAVISQPLSPPPAHQEVQAAKPHKPVEPTPIAAPDLPEKKIQVATPVAKPVPSPVIETQPSPVVSPVKTEVAQIPETNSMNAQSRAETLRTIAAEMETLFAEKISW